MKTLSENSLKNLAATAVAALTMGYTLILMLILEGTVVGKTLETAAKPLGGLLNLLVPAGGAFWAWKAWMAKKKKFQRSRGRVVIALQVGRPVADAVKQHFGTLDCIIDVTEVAADGTLRTDRHYKRLSQLVYRAIKRHQGKQIDIVLSGPLSVSFFVGQLVGLHHYDVVFHQFDPSQGGYVNFGQPDRTWM